MLNEVFFHGSVSQRGNPGLQEGIQQGRKEEKKDRTRKRRRRRRKAKVKESEAKFETDSTLSPPLSGIERVEVWSVHRSGPSPINTANMATFPSEGTYGLQPTGNTDPYSNLVGLQGNAQYGTRGRVPVRRVEVVRIDVERPPVVAPAPTTANAAGNPLRTVRVRHGSVLAHTRH